MDFSLEDLRDAVSGALVAKFGTDAFGTPVYVLVETFPDYVIARGPNSDLYRISFTVSSDDGDVEADDIQLGDPQHVQIAYMPVAQEASFLVIESASTPEDDGWTWPVQIIRAGPATGAVEGQGVPHFYTLPVVAEFASAVNGARFGRRHLTPTDHPADPALVAGWFTDGRMVGEAAHAKVHLLKTESEMRDRLMAAHSAKKMDLFNLSVRAAVAFKPGMYGSQKVLESAKLGKLWSVDLVTEAGAGGRFLSVSASKHAMHEIAALQHAAITLETGNARRAGRNKGAEMKPRILKVLEALRKIDAGRATQLTTEFESLQENKHTEFFATVSEALVTAASAQPSNTSNVEEARAALLEAKKITSSNMLDRKLGTAKLPAPAESLVRERFKDQVVQEAEVDAHIATVRKAFADYSNVGKLSGRTTIVMESTDKVQSGLDKMLGVKEAVADANVRAFRGVQEAYVFITGDGDLAFGNGGRGGFSKVSESTSLTSDFPNLLLNSMTKKLLQDYAEVGMNGVDMLYSVVPIADFKSQDRVRMGYLGDLSTVTEDGAYTDFAKPTDEKVSYSASKRGNTFPISRETILNDDLQKLTAIPGRIARASRRSLKQFIINFLINNPNYGADSVSWFNSAHANLGSNALSIDELILREIALYNQTEKDSNKPLGLTLDWIAVPINLKAQAYKINRAEQYNPGPAIFEPNPFWQRFGANNERIVVVELFSDTNDWYYGTMPSNAPFLEIGFVQDQREPVILLQNDPTTGAVFTNDRITYKVRHEYGGAATDFRGIGKNVVP